MLFHVPGFSSRDGCELSQNASEALQGAWQCGHADMINNILVVPDLVGAGRRYVTTGRDGFVKVWHPNLTLQKAIDASRRSSRGRFLEWMRWATAADGSRPAAGCRSGRSRGERIDVGSYDLV